MNALAQGDLFSQPEKRPPPVMNMLPYKPSLAEQAWEYIHSPEGRQVANKFIRIAYGVHLRGKKIGAKAIWERLRWHYEVSRREGEDFKLNNSFVSYVARFSEEREPALRGFFEKRAVNRKDEQ